MTDNVNIAQNLDPNESIPLWFNIIAPNATSNYSYVLTVYDSLGNAHVLTIYFRKYTEIFPGAIWQWFTVVSGSDNANSSIDEVQAQGTLTFAANGALYIESAIIFPTGGFDFFGGAKQNQEIAFNFGTSIVEGGAGLDGTTQLDPSSLATAVASILENLDPDALILSPFDISDPNATSNYSSSVTVYDSLGFTHVLKIYFRKNTAGASGNTWEWFAVVNAAENANNNGDEVQAKGILSFDTYGALDSESSITYPAGGFDFYGFSAQDQIIDFDFGTSIAEGGTGLDGTTQRGSSTPATTNINVFETLNPSALIVPAFDVTNPVSTSNHSTSVTVYDSHGIDRTITIYFRKNQAITVANGWTAAYAALGGNEWQWYAVVSAADATAGIAEIQADGTLEFNTDGALYRESIANYPTGGFDFSGGVPQDQMINYNFGTSIYETGTGLDGTTQKASSTPATSYFLITEDLDSSASIPQPFDVLDPVNTSNHSNTFTTYDSLGSSHAINIYFRKNQVISIANGWASGYPALGGNEWQWFAVVSAADTVSGTVQIQANGTLEFHTSGALFNQTPTNYLTGGFDFSGGATQNQPVVFDFGDDILNDSSTGLNGTKEI